MGNLFLILYSDVRVQILRELGAKGNCSFSELYRVCRVSAGTLAYHLTVLNGLVSKKGHDYCLTEIGRYACKLIKEVEDFEEEYRCVKRRHCKRKNIHILRENNRKLGQH